MVRKVRVYFFSLLLLLVALAGCGPLPAEEATPAVTPLPSPTPDGFKGKVTVGGVFDLSGASSIEGREYALGAIEYAAYLNSRGGANGYKIELRAADFSAKAPVAIEQYQRLVKEGAVAFLAWDKADTLALSRQLKNDHVPLLSASYTEDLVNNLKEQPYTFMIAPSYTDQIKLALMYAKRTRYDQTRINEPMAIGFLYSDDEFGRNPLQVGRDYSQQKGIFWFHEGIFQPKLDRANLVNETNRLRIARPEFTLVQARPDLVAEILKVMRAAAVPTAFIGLNYTASPDLPQQAGKAAEGYMALAVIAYPDEPEPGLEEMRNWMADRRAQLISEVTPSIGTKAISFRFVQGWATMKALTEGIRQALIANPGGNLNGDKVKEGLENIRQFDMGGLTAPLTFGPEKHKGTDAARVMKVENGKWKVVTPFLSLTELEYQNSLPTPTPPSTTAPPRR